MGVLPGMGLRGLGDGLCFPDYLSWYILFFSAKLINGL